MRVLLIGYGKMGKQIAQIAHSQNITISAIVSRSCDSSATPFHNSLTTSAIDSCDVAIDFSSQENILKRISLLAEAKKPVVIGTTGWQELEPDAKKIIKEHNSCAITAPNFALGVGLFLLLAKQASRLMSHFPQYDVGISEHHHRKKQDAPSGTALKLAKNVLTAYPEKSLCVNPSLTESIPENALHLAFLRSGYIPGTHELIFDTVEDTITLSHVSRNREGFAKGALTAASWIIDKKGYFTLDDLLSDKLKGSHI